MPILYRYFLKVVRYSFKCLKWLGFLLFSYFLMILIGLFPVNRNFTEPEDGITIYVVSSAVHADIIVPKETILETQLDDWQKDFGAAYFKGETSNATHIAFGWGDRGFFLNTQSWDDLKFSTAARALFFPSQSVMHIDYSQPSYYADKVGIKLTSDQYARLVNFISSSFARDESQEVIQIENIAYSDTDAFFVAHGSYHLFNTCNSWVARALKAAGVKVPWLAPMPKSPMMYIGE